MVIQWPDGGKKDYVVEIESFKSNTQVYDPEESKNFETLSMVLVDLDYNGSFFDLNMIFRAKDILDEKNQASRYAPCISIA